MIIITHRNNPSALSLHRPARNYPLLIVKSILVVKKKTRSESHSITPGRPGPAIGRRSDRTGQWERLDARISLLASPWEAVTAYGHCKSCSKYTILTHLNSIKQMLFRT